MGCLLANCFVQVPTYLQYILVNGVMAKGIAFLRLPGAAIFCILSKLSGTKRQKKRLWSQQYMQVRLHLPFCIELSSVLTCSPISQRFSSARRVIHHRSSTHCYYGRTCAADAVSMCASSVLA